MLLKKQKEPVTSTWLYLLFISHLIIDLCSSHTSLKISAPQTLPEICSEQDEMDFLMEALIMRCSTLRQHIVLVAV